MTTVLIMNGEFNNPGAVKEIIKEWRVEKIIILGNGITKWADILGLKNVAGIYGVEDNKEITRATSIYNSCWLADGIHEIGNLRIMAINGVVGGIRKYWFDRSLDEVIKFAYAKATGQIDALITYNGPHFDIGSCILEDVAKAVQPAVWITRSAKRPASYYIDEILVILLPPSAMAILRRNSRGLSSYVLQGGKVLYKFKW